MLVVQKGCLYKYVNDFQISSCNVMLRVLFETLLETAKRNDVEILAIFERKS